MTPLDDFNLRYAEVKRSKDVRALVNLAWNAGVLTLRERGAAYAFSLPLAPMPSGEDDHSIRYLPYWRGVEETDLMALLDRLHRFRRG